MPESCYAVTAVATTAIAAAVQLAAWRLAGHPVPPALLASHLLIVGAVHLAAALTLGRLRERRVWAASLLLLPPLFAALPALDRAGGTAAVLAAGCGGALLVFAGSRWGRAPGRPLLAALLGAVSGVAVAAACRGLQLESPPHTPGPGMKLFLVLLALVTLLALFGPGPRAALPRPAVSLGIAVVALAAAAVAGRTGLPRPLPDAPGRTGGAPPIVLIVLDTLRADHLRSYGYGRDSMPRLERFAREHAVRIERATSNAPSSLETHGSIFTGLLPHRHGAHKPRAGDPRPPAYGHALRPDVPTLALRLRRAGYWPVGISANFGPLSPEFGLSRGFGFYEARSGLQRGPALYDPFRFALWRRWPLASLDRLPPFAASDFFELGVPYRRAGEIADRALEALDRAGETPLFLFLNFMEPHYPYRSPRSFTRIFPGIRRPGLRRLDDEQAAAHEIMAGRRAMTAEEQVAWNAAYDSALLYLDGELARVLDALQRHPRFGETLVVITSDHGEAFGEHGLFRHSTALYDEMLAVPLFLKPGARRPAGFAAGRSLPGPFQPVDLFPTLLDHAGLPVPSGLDGYAWGRGRRAAFAEGYPHPPAAALGERFRRELRAVEQDGWKLIVSSAGEVELYDLVRDPGETRNVAAAHTGRAAEMGRLLAERTTAGAPARPGGRESDELVKALRSLGYVP